ncbi:MAG: carboxymuconolactone decarboxylase [Acidimicrobiales bacterium]|jgi:alkylhydroperoxidase family enzyme|nr:carboxymuconolactone decarboxylase [Acidimicrobiales bacterium]
MNDLLALLARDARLDSRLRELAIMRIGWLTESDYEWTQHWRIARKLGVPDDDLLGVRDWKAYAGFGPAERAVLMAADELVVDGSITATTFGECSEALQDDELVLLELVATLSTWRMIASILQSLDVPLEEGVDSWPPDGRSPADVSVAN